MKVIRRRTITETVEHKVHHAVWAGKHKKYCDAVWKCGSCGKPIPVGRFLVVFLTGHPPTSMRAHTECVPEEHRPEWRPKQ